MVVYSFFSSCIFIDIAEKYGMCCEDEENEHLNMLEKKVGAQEDVFCMSAITMSKGKKKFKLLKVTKCEEKLISK